MRSRPDRNRRKAAVRPLTASFVSSEDWAPTETAFFLSKQHNLSAPTKLQSFDAGQRSQRGATEVSVELSRSETHDAVSWPLAHLKINVPINKFSCLDFSFISPM